MGCLPRAFLPCTQQAPPHLLLRRQLRQPLRALVAAAAAGRGWLVRLSEGRGWAGGEGGQGRMAPAWRRGARKQRRSGPSNCTGAAGWALPCSPGESGRCGFQSRPRRSKRVTIGARTSPPVVAWGKWGQVGQQVGHQRPRPQTLLAARDTEGHMRSILLCTFNWIYQRLPHALTHAPEHLGRAWGGRELVR